MSASQSKGEFILRRPLSVLQPDSCFSLLVYISHDPDECVRERQHNRLVYTLPPPISLLLLHLPKSFSHTSPLLLPPASERLVELHKREALIELRID